MMSATYQDSELVVRQAKKEDMVAVADMIQELADFEKMPDGPKLTVKDLERDCFELQPPLFLCKVAQEAGGAVVGYAIYFPTYSTWEGRATMLEDLYVRPAARRRGAGARLFDAVAEEAAACGSRLDFHVLSWNPARAWYSARGATDLTRAEGWHAYRLAGAPLARHGARGTDRRGTCSSPDARTCTIPSTTRPVSQTASRGGGVDGVEPPQGSTTQPTFLI